MPEFAPVLVVSALNGANGSRLDGDAAFDYSGRAAAGGGDVNGDGFADLLIGAPFSDAVGADRGAAWLVFGAAATPSAQKLNARLAAGTAYEFLGEAAGDLAGYAVANAGDVNGDGFDDLIIGASTADPDAPAGDRGASYLIFGGAAKLEAFDAIDGANENIISLANISPAAGFRFDGGANSDLAGFSVSGAGDVNGDGIADLLIGALYADPNSGGGGGEGASYIVFGGTANLTALDAADGAADGRIDLINVAAGQGLRLDGATTFAGDQSGRAVALVGDVNGDGFADALVGAPNADPNGVNNNQGAAYLVFGRPGALFTAASLDLASLTGLEGARFDGAAASDNAGRAVGGLGDVNGDGFADFAIGAPFAMPSGGTSGSAYVVFGRSGFGASSDLAALDGMTGFRIDGLRADDRAGFSVSSAGDINGDGFADILVGALGFDRLGAGDAGAAFVVFGKASGFSPVIGLGTLNGDTGFRIEGAALGDLLGFSVSAAGDVNGDGFDDLIAGALGANNNALNNSGSTYVICGHRADTAVTRVGTALDNTINGGKEDDSISGLGGNDALIGWEGDDIVEGGAGNDSIDGGAGSDLLNGGSGDDNFKMSFGFDEIDGGSGKDTLDFRNLSGSAVLDMGLGTYTLSQSQDDGTFSEVEQVIMTNGGDTITGSSRNDIIQAAKGNDTVNGGAGADFIAGNYGRDTLTGGLGNDTFDYNALSESATNSNIRDIITDFKVSGADKIDLGTLDANATIAGNQAFTFLATLGAAFTAAGQVRFTQSGGNTFVDVNTDANLATIEMQIQLTGLKTLVAADFVL